MTPSSSDEPMTWPPLMPPPAIMQLKTGGVMVAAGVLLIFGVRPNSLSITIMRLLQHARRGQVLDQRGQGRVHHLAVVAHGGEVVACACRSRRG